MSAVFLSQLPRSKITLVATITIEYFFLVDLVVPCSLRSLCLFAYL